MFFFYTEMTCTVCIVRNVPEREITGPCRYKLNDQMFKVLNKFAVHFPFILKSLFVVHFHV